MTRSPTSAQAIVAWAPTTRVAADAHAGADDRVGADQRAGADLRAGADHRAGIDDDARFEPRRRMDEGGGRNAGFAERRARPGRLRIEARHRLGHRPIGLRRDEQGAALRRLSGVARRNERRAGAGRAEGVEVARIVEEGQVVRARFVERRDVADDPVGIGAVAELRAGPLRDLAERRRGGERKKADLRHDLFAFGRLLSSPAIGEKGSAAMTKRARSPGALMFGSSRRAVRSSRRR